MRVLLTGMSGKSGLAMAEYLAERPLEGIEYRIAIRSLSNLPIIQQLLPKAEICMGDLSNDAFLDSILMNVDVVFHIAGILLSPKLVETAVRHGVRRMILVHTTGIYSRYKAAGKRYRAIEREIDIMAEHNGISVTYLRPTMIFGTLEDHNMIQFIRMVDRFNPMPIVNHANYYLQPVYYKDLGQAYYQVLSHLDVTNGKNYIISGEAPITLYVILRTIAQELGVRRHFVSIPFPVAYLGAWMVFLLSAGKMDYREKVQRLCEDRQFSHDNATKDFGYCPRPFVEAVRREIQAYRHMMQ